MARECIIMIYLFVFKILFNFFKLFRLKDKTTFIVSFGDNSSYVYNELRKKDYPGDIVFLKNKNVTLNGSYDKNVKIYQFETYHVLDTFFSIYHLATSKYIFIDNYYGFLAGVKFKKSVTCTQLWHAAGAIKKFGLMDPTNETRSKRANARFLKVYNRFDRIVVGSEKLAEIYYKAFAATDKKILRTGIPRTDLFYNEVQSQKKRQKMFDMLPNIRHKKVILYAPTYRESDLHCFELHLNVKDMVNQLGHEYIILLKLHPAVNGQYQLNEELSGRVIDCSGQFKINDLLFITDFLITDYSSIPFEFSILEKPMIFYPYDMESYKSERGFWEDYSEFVPGPVVYKTKEIIDVIINHKFDYEKIREFKGKWNEYSRGHASESLVKELFFKQD